MLTVDVGIDKVDKAAKVHIGLRIVCHHRASCARHVDVCQHYDYGSEKAHCHLVVLDKQWLFLGEKQIFKADRRAHGSG